MLCLFLFADSFIFCHVKNTAKIFGCKYTRILAVANKYLAIVFLLPVSILWIKYTAISYMSAHV